jgi:cytochrome c-type biogenesis protein CcmH
MIWGWLLFAVVTACVIVAIARPLVRTALPAEGAASEIDAYKLQLAELNREEARGTFAKEEAEQTRLEISRRLLKASRKDGASSHARYQAVLNSNMAFAGLAAVIALGAAGLYAIYGAAGLPDQPLEARLNAPVERQPVGIQIANVERRLRANPKDLPGWTVIAPVYLKIGQFDKAANAYRRAMQLGGEDEEKLLGLFQSLTFANGGVVPAGAKPALDAALSRNPQSLRGRLWLAILAGQDGRKADAAQIYEQLLSENIPEPMKRLINKQLADLNEKPALPAGSENRQASGGAPEGDQSAMIRGMVDRLAARLMENGEDLEGWLKLIRSYAVLKETKKAWDAAASARAQFASEPKALEQIENLAQSLGLRPGDENGGQPKS